MDRTHHVYLVPGFLGFASLGRITYFGHVRRILGERLAALGLEARVHMVRAPPTASLPARRFEALWAAVARLLVGGALARPLATGHPKARLPWRTRSTTTTRATTRRM